MLSVYYWNSYKRASLDKTGTFPCLVLSEAAQHVTGSAISRETQHSTGNPYFHTHQETRVLMMQEAKH